MTHISLRVPTEELEQWRHHAGREPLSRWIRRTINQALAAQGTAPGPCATCGRNPALGYASIDGEWYCHPDYGQSCYIDKMQTDATDHTWLPPLPEDEGWT